jgi:hypothetical protein
MFKTNRAKDRTTSLIGLVAVGSLVLGLSGCGSSSQRTSNPPATAATSGATTPTTQPIGAFAVTRTWRWQQTKSGGYTEGGSLSIGSPVSAASAPRLPGFSSPSEALSDCGGDQNTDALLPVEVVVTNDTTNFPSALTDTFWLWTSGGAGGGAPPVSLSVDAAYSTGTSCVLLDTSYNCSCNGGTGSDGWTVGSNSDVAPGSSVQVFGYFVLGNYFTPDQPNGDAAVLDSSILQLSAGYWNLTSLTGPGTPAGAANSSVGDAPIYGAIPLSGRTLSCTTTSGPALGVTTCSAS